MLKDWCLVEFREETEEAAFDSISEQEVTTFWVLLKLLNGFSGEEARDIVTASASLYAAFQPPLSSQTH